MITIKKPFSIMEAYHKSKGTAQENCEGGAEAFKAG